MRSFTRLRTSSHRLRIEIGRYQGIPRHNRICTKCSANEIEDEIHFLFQCSKYKDDRELTLHEVENTCSNLSYLDDQNKLIWLLSNENPDLLNKVCRFIQKNLP